MGFFLGLHGPALSCKDTIADYLINELKWDAKLSFSKNLKEMCMKIFSLSEFDVNDQDGKKQVFERPIVFTEGQLGSIMFWMARTHPNARVPISAKDKVKSLVGRELFTPTDVCRELVPTYHADIVEQQVNKIPDQKVVITDVRFPNEGDIILDKWGGIVVEIVRSDLPMSNINRSHASETSMASWGRFNDSIKNSREGLSFLYEEVNNLLRRHNLCPSEKTT